MFDELITCILPTLRYFKIKYWMHRENLNICHFTTYIQFNSADETTIMDNYTLFILLTRINDIK